MQSVCNCRVVAALFRRHAAAAAALASATPFRTSYQVSGNTTQEMQHTIKCERNCPNSLYVLTWRASCANRDKTTCNQPQLSGGCPGKQRLQTK